MDLKELDRLFADMGFELNAEELEAIHLFLDADGSHTLTFDEFFGCWQALASKKGILRADKLKLLVSACKLFKQYDKDNSKLLSIPEFTSFHQKLSEKYEDMDPIEQVLAELDKNGDEKINFQEFINCLNWFSV
ncbi:predicted protein [Naegleria gruberi]|uniref:Predicted protein n=1 Tax=Naegleria gruberi TaxID=5762 RepID=D2VAX2_NAEGR|nr:uncharacterized protein NAEGRDRAFT_66009 [Naegleria gruberi]EFC46155.1 predicted protein [Naegleria gruberi]|eukprot:XP_002678899.1 predicted protein [Naegleria gruberi strain NEG-M]